jgi:signal transduction histidine kinase/sensor domain CHASE-containing protein
MRDRISDNQNILSKSPLLISILAAVVVFVTSILIIEQRRNIITTHARLELSAEMKRVNEELNLFFEDMYSGLAAIARIIDNNGEVHHFEETAKEVLKNNPRLSNISLIPGGIIKYTYPATNEAALNKSILNTRSGEEVAGALAAYHSKKIKIAGPFKNFANVECIAARLPVFINGEFWGFSSAVIKLEDLLKATGITDTAQLKYQYSLSYISHLNQKEVFFLGHRPGKRQTTVDEDVPYINWRFYISNKGSGVRIFLLPAILSLLGSIIIAIIIRKRLERTLRLKNLISQKDRQIADAEKDFKAIFDNAPIGFALVNNDGILSSANNRFISFFDLEKPSPDASQHPVKQILNAITYTAGGPPDDLTQPISGRYKHINKEGKELWINYKLFALPSTAERKEKYVVIAEDITDKLIAEQKLKVSERKYRHLFNESPVALWEEDFSDVVKLLSENGLSGKPEKDIIEYFNKWPDQLPQYARLVKVKSVNDECFRQYKLGSKEELLQNLSQYISQQPTVTTVKYILAAICSGKHQFKSESTFRTAEGELRYSVLSWQVIPGHEEHYDQVILTTVDVTDLKKSKEDLKRSMEILDSQNKRLLDFSYIVSHNLRSHTSNIQSLSDLILSTTSVDEKIELIAHLHKVVNILNNTIEGLNDVISIHSDLNITQQHINLKAVADRTINILSNKIKHKDAVILNIIPQNATIYYNKAYIESILLNLISNSLKYSKPGICPLISITYSENESRKLLAISDNGIGIDLEKNGHTLFGLFKTFTHNPDSKGVGLYITKRQIEAMGGKITVESTVNAGTTFKIYFK